MNTLLMLVLATSTPASEPQPLPVGPANPPPVVIVNESEWSEPAQSSRPHLFGKVRNYISHKLTQITDKVSGNTPRTIPAQTTVQGEENNGVVPVRLVPTVAPRTIRSVYGDSPEPPLADPLPPQG